MDEYYEKAKLRFDAKYVVDEDAGCWLWQGSKHPLGYGMMSWHGKPLYAHRAAYMLYVGQIPLGEVICHSCDNTSCVNPEHLFCGSQKENVHDAVNKNRFKARLAVAPASRKYIEEVRTFLQKEYKMPLDETLVTTVLVDMVESNFSMPMILEHFKAML